MSLFSFDHISVRTLIFGIIIGTLAAALAIAVYAGKSGGSIIGSAEEDDKEHPKETTTTKEINIGPGIEISGDIALKGTIIAEEVTTIIKCPPPRGFKGGATSTALSLNGLKNTQTFKVKPSAIKVGEEVPEKEQPQAQVIAKIPVTEISAGGVKSIFIRDIVNPATGKVDSKEYQRVIDGTKVTYDWQVKATLLKLDVENSDDGSATTISGYSDWASENINSKEQPIIICKGPTFRR